MTEKTPHTSESFELSEKDEADLAALIAEVPAEYHTILEIWREVLVPSAAESEQKVQAGWASRITQQYPQIKVQEMDCFRDTYFSKIAELKDILNFEISTDDKALSYTTPESDAEQNSGHYKNLLLLWQSAVLQWEQEWNCIDELAHVEIAAISEVHKMFFSQTGITAFLDNIGFQFDETDQAELAAALEELKAGL